MAIINVPNKIWFYCVTTLTYFHSLSIEYIALGILADKMIPNAWGVHMIISNLRSD